MPCFAQCLGASGGLKVCSAEEGNVDLSLSSSRNCLAALALLCITLAWGRSGVNLDVDGIASASANCLKNAGSSGWMGRLS